MRVVLRPSSLLGRHHAAYRNVAAFPALSRAPVLDVHPNGLELVADALAGLPTLAENPENKVLVVPTGFAGLATPLSNLGTDGTKPNGVAAGTPSSRASRRTPAERLPALIQQEQPATGKP